MQSDGHDVDGASERQEGRLAERQTEEKDTRLIGQATSLALPLCKSLADYRRDASSKAERKTDSERR